MQEVAEPAAVRTAAAEARGAGRRVALVATMGYLHEGHVSLVAAARRAADFVVMSIFVNPLQFAPNEDLATYPRDLARDRALADRAGVDLLWVPTVEMMYPVSPAVTVHPGPVGEILEGAVRPGHFAGVLTVVLKLLNVVRPDVAVFGRKDAQQASLVTTMVRDLDLAVRILVAPTVRDADGLALSSRNVYLDAPMRARALALPRAMAAGAAAFRGGERRAGQVIAAAWRELDGEPGVVTEYLNVVDPETFMPSHAATAGSLLVGAVRVGPKRLLDNVVLGAGTDGDPRIGAGTA